MHCTLEHGRRHVYRGVMTVTRRVTVNILERACLLCVACMISQVIDTCVNGMIGRPASVTLTLRC